MKTSWRDELQDKMPEDWAQEIDVYESQLSLRREGKIEEKLFAETRLRRGAYGQRYDNGQRHDGIDTQTLALPEPEITKGPNTLWHAPGMHRIKLPAGKVTPEQLEILAAVAEEYSDAILHVTTRQDIQLHFVHIDDTPDMMRRLAACGITTREACGNSVRNVTACPYSGVCHDEAFDVTPYAQAFTDYFLGHPDVQDFGRKFKVAFSGCRQHACALTYIHDLGAIATTREVDGVMQRGFEVYVGGGLGAVPHQAKLLEAFVSEEELLPLSQAICRVFARLGEKKNRARARIKFLVAKLGLEEFKRLVDEERKALRPDQGWTAYIASLAETTEPGADSGTASTDESVDAAPAINASYRARSTSDAAQDEDMFDAWRRTNLRAQKQPGFLVATIALPLGDFTSLQARELARMTRKFTGDTIRTTVTQNMVFRWIRASQVPEFYQELKRIGLADAGADTVSDITSCPGTDTCKLGISSSRGLAGKLREHLRAKPSLPLSPSVDSLRIKASGCFNACGQHHIADIGFLGVSRNVKGRRVPHFQLVVGGQWSENAAAVGLAVGAIPSKRVPEAVDRLTEWFLKERQEGETFQTVVRRVGKLKVREVLKDLLPVPDYAEDRSFYSDWGDPREYTIGDMGVGECAGEIVPFAQFGLAASEREVLEAQVKLDEGDSGGAVAQAYQAMLEAAKALTRSLDLQTRDDPEEIVADFRKHLHETKLFHDTYAGDKFAAYFFELHQRHASGATRSSADEAHQTIEQTQLFIEAAHACYDRIDQAGAEKAAAARAASSSPTTA